MYALPCDCIPRGVGVGVGGGEGSFERPHQDTAAYD